MKGKSYTLITGASSGIGRSIAMYCGSRGMNLILVSLPGERLAEVAGEIEAKFNVSTRCFETDLTQTDAPQSLFRWTESEGLEVNMLVNNAGMGGICPFADSDLRYIDERILLNVRASVMLTRLYLPVLRRQSGAFILFTGSLAGFYPIPFKSLYSSSKAFLLTFSRSIRYELKGSGVKVSILCPNGVRTNESATERINKHLGSNLFMGLTADDVARMGIEGMLKGKAVIVPGLMNRMLLVLRAVLPVPVQQRMLESFFRKELTEKQE